MHEFLLFSGDYIHADDVKANRWRDVLRQLAHVLASQSSQSISLVVVIRVCSTHPIANHSRLDRPNAQISQNGIEPVRIRQRASMSASGVHHSEFRRLRMLFLNLRQRPLKDVKRDGCFVLVDDERRAEADRSLAAA